MTIVSTRDVQEIVSRLSSEKAKAREEGIKLLNSWLEGERSFNFCKYLAQNTKNLEPDQIPHSETWPFLIGLLIKCVSLEVSSSKKRSPKLIFAKTLRLAVQRAEDGKVSGNMLLLSSAVKSLFAHVWDVSREIRTFQSEYGIILRHLLAVSDYRFHMRKRVYRGFLLLYMEKVTTSLSTKSSSQHNPKEEVFRCIQTFHSLLENPPGDFPDILREDVVKGIIKIFSCIRDEGKISRKLFECINAYLLKDGPNLGSQSLEIHNAVHQFVFRYWLTTHDHRLKEVLISYARLQLNLVRDAADGSTLVEQLLDIIVKELDQSNSGAAWSDSIKDDKYGALASSQYGLVALAASVLYRACVDLQRTPLANKRPKREPAAAHLLEKLKTGKWLWDAAFCHLVRHYHAHISRDLFVYWFGGICASFQRILNDANMEHAYEGLLWTLRSLQELSFVLLVPVIGEEDSSCNSNELSSGWQTIWSSLMHGLPILSNVTVVVDVALPLLGNLICSGMINTTIISRDVWDLQIFKRVPSLSVLYFISCYFSRRGSQGDIQGNLFLRENLLRAVMGLTKSQEGALLNERMVILFPEAVYALCAGCASNLDCCRTLLSLHSSADSFEFPHYWFQKEEHGFALFECSVEVLVEIDLPSGVQVAESEWCNKVRLPRQLRDPLLYEMETCLLSTLANGEIEKMFLSDVFFTCSLLSNFIYSAVSLRLSDGLPSFVSKAGHYISDLVDHAVVMIQQSQKDIQSHGCLSLNSIFEGTSSLIASFRSFVSCPLFVKQKDQDVIDVTLYTGITHSIERFLNAVAKLYEDCSACMMKMESSSCSAVENDFPNAGTILPNSRWLGSVDSRIMDIELDVVEDSKNAEAFSVESRIATGISCMAMKWKLDMISLISCFFSVLPIVTWEILFHLMENESNSKACADILCTLCRHPHWSSSSKLVDLVFIIDTKIETQMSLKRQFINIISAICGLLGSLLSSATGGTDNFVSSSLKGRVSEQSLSSLGDLVNKISEFDLDWFGRIKLIDCICKLIGLNPQIGQTMIGKLLTMLRDIDYRVRFFLARRVGLLFQTWDGHNELFNDICSNFGIKMVISTNEKLVTAAEVLAAGPQPCPRMETIIVTLMHLAAYSEKIEIQAVFMMCAVSAMDPCQRELVTIALDSLSKRLHYANRSKYLEELMGSVLFCWVACGISLAALVEIRDIFVMNVEPSTFLLYCCPSLLPALILYEDTSNLKWVATICSQSVALLVKEQFVPVFSICIGLHCSKKSGWENGTSVLQGTILHLAEISESERDVLIQKYMVSIVSHILSLSSSLSDPAMPSFSRKTVVLAIQTVVDGFLELDSDPTNLSVVDKINIFRPDRVFMFIVELHHKIAAAVHYRHKCHRLAGIEVLVDVLGDRAAVSSTSNYLFNLVGQFIGFHALQDQCCRIIFTLLGTFKINPSKEIVIVLGEQLQFLVSKLVACCIPLETHGELSRTQSSQVVSLIHQLTVDSDPSLYDYIRELEPFPELGIFVDIRKFHEELGQAYSPRDHFLKFVKRSCNLPPRLFLWSLQALHKKVLIGEVFQGETDGEESTSWRCDPEIVHAVWKLVRLCGSNEASSVRALVSDFISWVGVGDPHSVVFHLPEDFSHIHVCPAITQGSNFKVGSIPDELLIALVRLLKKYLMDESVKIIDMTSQVLRGIFSTEMGQRVLAEFDCYEKSLIEIHSKGVNVILVEKLLSDLERKFKAEAVSLEMASLWSTQGKTFENWICQLVYSLIGYCDDTILRLCQDIVLVKAEVAELLFPNVIVNLAGRKDLAHDFCRLISMQVQENIFIESNKLMKSIQVLLNALNELRLCHVIERMTSSSGLSKASSGSKSRSASIKAKDSSSGSFKMTNSTSSWDKVFWLSIDYLLVAKSAISCGSYFTSILYVEHWCEEHFDSLTVGTPDFSPLEKLPQHIEILLSAVTKINEPDSLYGIIQSHKLSSQITTFEHEGNWSKALEYYDLQVRSSVVAKSDYHTRNMSHKQSEVTTQLGLSTSENVEKYMRSYKGLIRSLQQVGCTHMLDLYCRGLTCEDHFQHDHEFTELQYEAAWRVGNWEFSSICVNEDFLTRDHYKSDHFNENLHICLRALQEGDVNEFYAKLEDSKQELVLSVHHASEESTEYIFSTIIKLQIFYHLGMSWDLRWKTSIYEKHPTCLEMSKLLSEPVVPTVDQLSWLSEDWSHILKRTQLHMSFLEPFIAFRRVLLQIFGCKDRLVQHLLQAAATLRKGSRFSQAAAALHEFKFLCNEMEGQQSTSYWLGRLEEAKLLRAQGQLEMAINLAKYVSENYPSDEGASNVYRLVGKWLAENRSSNSRTILEKYLKRAVSVAEDHYTTDRNSIVRQSQMHFHLAHYTDALFRSYEERICSNEWQAAMRLRKHKTKELEALIRQLKSSTKGEKIDYSIKIQELQKQLAMDREEAEKLQDDRDNFLSLALEGYKRCLVIGDKYDVRVVFRLVSLWFRLSSRQIVVNSMLDTIKKVQSYKFIPLVYQIASRIGSSKDGQGLHSFQFALVSLVKKMAIDHPYHTIFQLLALENGDRIKDKQRHRNSFVVDIDKKHAAQNLLNELSSYHGAIIRQMKQMVEIYIKLAELETKREDTNKRVALPRDIRSLRQLELVPVVTSEFPVDRSCQYHEGSFPHFKGLADSVMIMNGINAPKVVECLGSDGHKYRQLAKSGNDDLRQDAVMEQFFALVNTFLQNHWDTWKRRLRIRTYKVVPFTPSAGVLEWVDGTIPLADYLIGSMRTAGAHGRYGLGNWPFLKCREHMTNPKDKSKAFREVCENFRPVMHYFFLERFAMPADWFEKRLAYTRSVAASSMVGYIVGLGDRHSMNILIDQATAEVVHIDLGVAFEQGLMLKTPEQVPFRLTRDIVDGMGVTGVEGVFRRCCEETLSVMRMNKEALLTIVEVFIHDPLYKWALSPLKALQRQKEIDEELETSLDDSDDECEGNEDAARALMRVKQKLDGYEGGEMRSVHGQVQQLIQDAIDADRLCRMFPGWAAWL